MDNWVAQIKDTFCVEVSDITEHLGETTIEVSADFLVHVARGLRDLDYFRFEQLIDLCVVDYLSFGTTEWETNQATGSGFSRAVDPDLIKQNQAWDKPRFAVVYHLLSISNNQRLRMKCFVPDESLTVNSVADVWASANWYEREAFDLFGIRFAGHEDLRRLLTDYGFVGHPFRKDFPLIGHLEMRYDATEQRCLYEPVSIEPRVLVPKVVRDDSRYKHPTEEN